MGGKRLYMGSFFDHFMVICDPQQEGKVRHKLMGINDPKQFEKCFVGWMLRENGQS